ncbi:MAG TPA: cysteine desulfurase family protein [Verrucomicrobiae bacterium]|nr:cysteine desulfurase family protein [Verrucomicrobiae bacterium]
MRSVYADYNATTPLDPRVLEVMLPYLRDHFGNASSVHIFGRDARAAIDDVRVRMARILGAQEGEIVFTGGGTEADNMAVFGAVRAHRKQGRHIITSTIEHHAVLHACQYLEKTGECEVTYLPVDRECLIDPGGLRQAIREDTVLVSIMSANNETGTIQPVKELAAICRERGVTFHTDAVQSFGKQPVNVNDWGVDSLSIAAHKFYGPKGVGALYVRRGTKLDPLLFGGSHENERRAGTENVAAIVGLGLAAELATAQMREEQDRLFDLTEKLSDGIAQRIRGAHRNGHAKQRIENTINFSFEGCEEEGLLLGLDLEGVAVSSGSACAVGSLQPSHVLQAMGLPHELARAAVRFSFGKSNTREDVDYILKAVERVVKRLRAFSTQL